MISPTLCIHKVATASVEVVVAHPLHGTKINVCFNVYMHVDHIGLWLKFGRDNAIFFWCIDLLTTLVDVHVVAFLFPHIQVCG